MPRWANETMNMQPEEITILGGGLVGALAAILLAQRGHRVAVYDRRPDMRRTEVAAGRSINLAVSARGLLALQIAGLQQAVLDIAVPMPGRMIHSAEGETTFIPYGQRPQEVIYSVSRGALNKLLLDHAGHFRNVALRFNQRCAGYDAASETVWFIDETTQREHRIHAATVLATDGSSSQVRQSFQKCLPEFRVTQEYLDHGYKEFTIPARVDGTHALQRDALHIWPRASYMLIALPNLDGSFTCTLFMPYEGEVSFASMQTPEQAVEFFEHAFPDAAALMPTLANDFAANPVGSMVTVRCAPWHIRGQAMLLGDAAHAIVPFFGQGMNCGFEDCTALAALLDSGLDDWAMLFAELQRLRKPNADAIADLALENFVEMRDTVADPKFQLKKQIGFELERRHPQHFIPRYAMVVFRPDIPYAEAQRRGIAQDAMLDQLTANIDSPDDVDWDLAERLLGNMAG